MEDEFVTRAFCAWSEAKDAGFEATAAVLLEMIEIVLDEKRKVMPTEVTRVRTSN